MQKLVIFIGNDLGESEEVEVKLSNESLYSLVAKLSLLFVHPSPW